MLRDSLKKIILFGLVAGLSLTSLTAQAHRDDDDDDDDDDDETPELVVRDGCDGNENSGLSLIQLCGTAIPLNILGLGDNEQSILSGLLGDDDGDDDGDDGDGDDGDGCSNDNSGTSLLQLCNTIVPLNILGLGDNEQSAATP